MDTYACSTKEDRPNEQFFKFISMFYVWFPKDDCFIHLGGTTYIMSGIVRMKMKQGGNFVNTQMISKRLSHYAFASVFPSMILFRISANRMQVKLASLF